ncbi:MAG: Phosphoglycolate phosphatase [Planctomycetota bacterium]
MADSPAAVVFDLDGTLLDSLRDIAETVNQVLEERQFPVHPLDRFRYLVGDGVVTLFERALPATADRNQWLQPCVARFHEVYDHHWNRYTRPYEGIVELIAELRSLRVPLAVLSNKPHPFTLKCVEEYFAADDFVVVLGQRDGVPRKPDPAGALEIAVRLDVPPQRCAYVGDSLVDMQTAVRSAMLPVGCLWGFRERDELLAHGAERLLARPAELLELFE